MNAVAMAPDAGLALREDPHMRRLAAYAQAASQRRGLSAGELADDMAEQLAAMAAAGATPTGGVARPFLEALMAGFEGAPQRLRLVCDADLHLSDLELAAVGITACEAVSNALRHAFPHGRVGDIWVSLAENEGRLVLRVRDNGIGMFDVCGDRNTGHGLIDALADNLGGFARFGSAPFGGADQLLVFPRTR